MGPDLEIGPCREGDLEGVYSIDREAFPDPWPWSVLNSMLRRGSAVFLVARGERGVLGYAIAILGGTFGFLRRDVGDGHLVRIAVRRGWRGRGIGTRLMDSLIEELRGEDVDDVTLEVRARNRAARGFYLKCGFEREDFREGYYRNGDDAIIMRREI